MPDRSKENMATGQLKPKKPIVHVLCLVHLVRIRRAMLRKIQNQHNWTGNYPLRINICSWIVRQNKISTEKVVLYFAQ